MAKKNMTLEEKMEEAVVKDGPYEVPGNWVWSKLEYIFDNVTSSGKKLKQSEYKEFSEEFTVPIVDQGENFVGGYSDKLELTYDGKLPILVFGDHSRCIKYVDFNFIQGADGVKILLSRGMNTKYLYYMLRNLKLPDKGYSRHYKFLREESMPIAPLKEQQRIVDRIESLFEKLDKAKELIEEAREGFEKRKSAVLVKAFTGVLTEKWRKNNNINNGDLLDKIMSENKKTKKNFTLTDPEELHDIPNNWSWIKLKDICEKFKYGTSAKSQTEGKVPVLRMGNLQQGKLVWDSLVYTSDEDEINKYDLINGDLLFNRTNSPELVGKTSIYNGEMKAIFAGYLIRIRVLNEIDSKYINYFMNSIYAKTRCMEVKSDGVSQSNINAEKLGDFDIPLPSSEEQKEIVKILDKLSEEESKIEELTQLEEQIELIKKSILAKAFRGELGTNSEEDESALELLKEILSKE